MIGRGLMDHSVDQVLHHQSWCRNHFGRCVKLFGVSVGIYQLVSCSSWVNQKSLSIILLYFSLCCHLVHHLLPVSFLDLQQHSKALHTSKKNSSAITSQGIWGNCFSSYSGFENFHGVLPPCSYFCCLLLFLNRPLCLCASSCVAPFLHFSSCHLCFRQSSPELSKIFLPADFSVTRLSCVLALCQQLLHLLLDAVVPPMNYP